MRAERNSASVAIFTSTKIKALQKRTKINEND